jgi:DNA-binding transcriptional ArsR family regulator
MVVYTLQLDSVFGSLADPTRRDILQRVGQAELSISQIAHRYDLSLAAVSKHIKILEKAKLVIKRRHGKQHLVRLAPNALDPARDYLEEYRQMWEERFEILETIIIKED